MQSRTRKQLVILAVILAAGFTLRFTVFAAKPVPISAFVVAPGKVEETVMNSKAGTVKVRRRANLSTEIGGRVVFLGAREGERVKRGELLLRLDDSEYRASLMLAQRAVESAEAGAREACTAAELAVRDYERSRGLKEQGIVSEEILDQLHSNSRAAAARCDAAQAETRRARASVSVADAALRKTELRAPFDGVVVQLSAELGEWVTPSPPGLPIPPIIDILDDSSVYIEAPMDETDAGRLRPGLPVRISLDSYPDQFFPGTVTRVSPFVRDVEGQNRTVDVEAEFTQTHADKTFLPGTSADIEVILNSRDGVLRVPTYALMEGNRVLVVEKNVLKNRVLKTGLRNWEYVEVREGLRDGDQVALSLDKTDVKEGARVRIEEEAKK
jgi:HlyD family secretion protein